MGEINLMTNFGDLNNDFDDFGVGFWFFDTDFGVGEF